MMFKHQLYLHLTFLPFLSNTPVFLTVQDNYLEAALGEAKRREVALDDKGSVDTSAVYLED